MKEVERLKEEGNTKFKEGRLADAVARYSETLNLIGDAEDESKGGQIRATVLSNRATNLVKLNNYTSAPADTSLSLSLFPNSFKALRTRAHLEEYEKAISDFNLAVEYATSEIKSLKTELWKTEVALKRSKTKDYYKIVAYPGTVQMRILKRLTAENHLFTILIKEGEEGDCGLSE